VNMSDVSTMFDGQVPMINSAADSLKVGGFAALYNSTTEGFHTQPGYTRHASTAPVAYRVGETFPEGIEENWRQVYLDVTKPSSVEELKSKEFLGKLAKWLTTEQPITLAVNGDDAAAGYPIAMTLFETTAQAVYSVGTADTPALTCQARPQDGEIFGEFPPRRQLTEYTKFPVIVPSSTPGYHTTYTDTYLTQQAAAAAPSSATSAIASLAISPHTKGYAITLGEYLHSACGPKRGSLAGGARTALWGLQRPPLGGSSSVVRCEGAATLDDAVTILTPFYVTNAREQVTVSVDPGLGDIAAALGSLEGLEVVSEDRAAFAARVESTEPWNVVQATHASELGFPLVDKLVSVLFPVGHIKSPATGDETFIEAFSKSRKWLAALD